MPNAPASSYQGWTCGLSNHSTEPILPASQTNGAVDEDENISCCSIMWANLRSWFIPQGNDQMKNTAQQASTSWIEKTISVMSDVNNSNEPTFSNVFEVQSPAVTTQKHKLRTEEEGGTLGLEGNKRRSPRHGQWTGHFTAKNLVVSQ